MKSFNQHINEDQGKLEEDLTDLVKLAVVGGGLLAAKGAWDTWGKGSWLANKLAITKSQKAKVAQDKIDKADRKKKEKETGADAAALGYEKDDEGNIKNEKDAQKYKDDSGKAPEGWKTSSGKGAFKKIEQGKVMKAKVADRLEKMWQSKKDRQAAKVAAKKDEPTTDEPTTDEPSANTSSTQGKVTTSNPRKVIGTSHKLRGKMTITESNELQAIMALDDEGIKAEINRKGQVVVKKKDLKKAKKALEKSFKKGGEPKLVGEEVMSAYDKVKAIRNRLNESSDEHAETELKLYIENDRDLYRQQIVPIIKNVQRRMKKGTYDHIKAPKLWMYLVDNGAKKYVKEFGGDVRSQFPKDVRQSVAVQFANEYRAEIEIQGGEMV